MGSICESFDVLPRVFISMYDIYRILEEISDWVGRQNLSKRRNSVLRYLTSDDTIRDVIRLNNKLDSAISRFGVCPFALNVSTVVQLIINSASESDCFAEEFVGHHGLHRADTGTLELGLIDFLTHRSPEIRRRPGCQYQGI